MSCDFLAPATSAKTPTPHFYLQLNSFSLFTFYFLQKYLLLNLFIPTAQWEPLASLQDLTSLKVLREIGKMEEAQEEELGTGASLEVAQVPL